MKKAAVGNGRRNAEGFACSDYYLGMVYAITDAIPSAIKAWENASLKGLDIEFMRDEMADVYRQLAARYFDI